MTKVLILTAGFGEGHNSAARALHSAFNERPGVAAEMLDLFALRAPRLNQVTRRAYLGLINRAPRAWSTLYRWLDRSPRAPLAFRALTGHKRLLSRLITQHQPAAICSTYTVYPWLLNLLHREGRLSCPHYTVVTDALTINSLWYRAESSGWFVTDADSAATLRAAGLPRNKVHVSGFPVALDFADRPADLQPPALRAGAPRRVLFMINSGRHLAFDTAAALLRQPGWHITFTTGRDTGLRRDITRLALNSPATADVLGWTDRIPELLMTHHLAVSKAGGATTQESINAHCPLIVNQIVLGQEEGNYELIRRLDAGALAVTPQSIVEIIQQAFANDALLWRRWRTNLQRHAQPSAARAIAAQVLAGAAQVTAPAAARQSVALPPGQFRPVLL